jgi:hypothetical protein
MTLEIVTSLIGFVAGVAVWSYSTFQTKEAHRETYRHIDKRLDQIEELLRYIIRRDDHTR